MKIYTKTGDDGMTSLVDGTRVPKTDALLSAYGTVDELNAFIGVVISEENIPFLTNIQRELFTIGGMLATPINCREKYWGNVDLESFIGEIEAEIDRMSAELPQSFNFILPQGNALIAHVHVCRTVCRRAEREVAALMQEDEGYKNVLKMLNRLSDFFYILAKFYHKKLNISETYWKSDK